MNKPELVRIVDVVSYIEVKLAFNQREPLDRLKKLTQGLVSYKVEFWSYYKEKCIEYHILKIEDIFIFKFLNFRRFKKYS